MTMPNPVEDPTHGIYCPLCGIHQHLHKWYCHKSYCPIKKYGRSLFKLNRIRAKGKTKYLCELCGKATYKPRQYGVCQSNTRCRKVWRERDRLARNPQLANAAIETRKRLQILALTPQTVTSEPSALQASVPSGKPCERCGCPTNSKYGVCNTNRNCRAEYGRRRNSDKPSKPTYQPGYRTGARNA